MEAISPSRFTEAKQFHNAERRNVLVIRIRYSSCSLRCFAGTKGQTQGRLQSVSDPAMAILEKIHTENDTQELIARLIKDEFKHQ